MAVPSAVTDGRGCQTREYLINWLIVVTQSHRHGRSSVGYVMVCPQSSPASIQGNAVEALRYATEHMEEEFQLAKQVLWLHDHAENLDVKH